MIREWRWGEEMLLPKSWHESRRKSKLFIGMGEVAPEKAAEKSFIGMLMQSTITLER